MRASPSRFTHTAGAALAVGAIAVAAPPARAADPTMSDCIQANESGIKLRAENKLRQARGQWLLCAAESCNAEIRNACKNRVSEVNRAIPTVVFDAKDPQGRDLTSVSVAMDGQPLAPRLEGTAISLDPGEHKFRFEMAGQPPVERTLVIAEGVKERHETIVIGGATGPAAAPAATAQPAAAQGNLPSDGTTAPPPPAAPAASPVTEAAPSGGSSMKTVGIVVGGAGVLGLVVGGVFGSMSFSKWSSAQSACQSATSCTNHSQAISDKNDASTDATVSTVSFVVGGLAAAVGAGLFFLSPSGGSSGASVGIAPSVGPGGTGLLVKGVF